MGPEFYNATRYLKLFGITDRKLMPKRYIDGKEVSEEEFKRRTQPVKKMTISELEKQLGHKIEVIAEESQGA